MASLSRNMPPPWSVARIAIPAAAALVSTAGSVVGMNLPWPAAMLLGVAAGVASAVPVRVTRLAAYIVAALAGFLLAFMSVLAEEPSLVIALLAIGAALSFAFEAWRNAVALDARAWERATAVIFAAAALFVLSGFLGQIGAEGGHCWFPGVPIGCLP